MPVIVQTHLIYCKVIMVIIKGRYVNIYRVCTFMDTGYRVFVMAPEVLLRRKRPTTSAFFLVPSLLSTFKTVNHGGLSEVGVQ